MIEWPATRTIVAKPMTMPATIVNPIAINRRFQNGRGSCASYAVFNAPIKVSSTADPENAARIIPTDMSPGAFGPNTTSRTTFPVSYTHLRAHETPEHLVCRLLLEKKKKE